MSTSPRELVHLRLGWNIAHLLEARRYEGSRISAKSEVVSLLWDTLLYFDIHKLPKNKHTKPALSLSPPLLCLLVCFFPRSMFSQPLFSTPADPSSYRGWSPFARKTTHQANCVASFFYEATQQGVGGGG